MSANDEIANMMDVLQGHLKSHWLEFHDILASDVVVANTHQGRVVYRGTDGKINMGQTGKFAPGFILRPGYAGDVTNIALVEAVQMTVQQVSQEKLTVLYAHSGFEIETNQFVSDETYTPGDFLTGVTGNAASTGGLLSGQRPGGGGAVRQYVDPICGFVGSVDAMGPIAVGNPTARGTAKRLNTHRKTVLRVLTYFLPAVFA